MKQRLWSLILVGLASGAHAQPNVLPPVQSAQSMSNERSRIEAERLAAKVEFGEKVTLCYAKFAVNGCIAESRRQQRLVLDALRKQEVALNKVAREQKVQAQLARLQANALNQPVEEASAKPVAPDVAPIAVGVDRDLKK